MSIDAAEQQQQCHCECREQTLGVTRSRELCVQPCPYARFSWAGWRLVLHRIKDVSALRAGVRSAKGCVTGGDIRREVVELLPGTVQLTYTHCPCTHPIRETALPLPASPFRLQPGYSTASGGGEASKRNTPAGCLRLVSPTARLLRRRSGVALSLTAPRSSALLGEACRRHVVGRILKFSGLKRACHLQQRDGAARYFDFFRPAFNRPHRAQI